MVTSHLVELEQGATDQVVVVALLLQKRAEQRRLDVAVPGAVDPVAEVLIAQRVAKQFHHTVLSGSFLLADLRHSRTSQCPPLA